MKVIRPGLLLFALLLSQFATAQTNVNEDQGLKPHDSTHGGELDSVSLTNGAMVLHIPLAAFPQRGNLGLSFSVYSNTKQWQLVTWCTVNQVTGEDNCQTQWMPLPRGGLIRYVGPYPHPGPVDGAYVASSLDWWLQSICNPDPPDPYYGTTSSTGSESLVSPDGNVHSFGAGTGPPYNCPYAYRSLDATGILHNPNSDIIMRDGTHFSYPGRSVSYQSSEPSAVTDADGNRVTIDSNTGAFTDTMGRVIAAPPGSGTSDLSNCPTGTSSASVWSVPGVGGNARTFKFCYSVVSIYTSFNDGMDYPPTNTSLLIALVLPDLTMWTFSYDHWGDITRLGLPTGGSISYTYSVSPQLCASSDSASNSMIVTSRTLDANDGTGGHTWNYSYSGQLISGGYSGNAIVTSPDGNEEVHSIGSPITGAPCALFDTQAQYYRGSHTGGTLLKTVATQYSGSISSLINGGAAINVVPTQVTTTWPAGHSTRLVNTWDSGNTATVSTGGTVPVALGSLLQRDDYDFSNALVRSTLNHYLWQDSATYLNANLLGLPVSAIVKNGSGTQIAQGTFAYDQVSVASSGVTQSLVGPPAGGNIRGNLTTSSHWLNTNNSFISSLAVYYDTGERASSTDPLNHTTTYSYSNSYAGAYVTGTCNALNQCVSGTYDFNTGLLTSFTDLNSNTYTYSYDSMLRLTQGNHPDGGWTKFFYPNPTMVERQRRFDYSGCAGSTCHDDHFVVFDGLGRTIQTQQTTSSGTVLADTTYDANGRVSTVSNPYYSGSNHSTDPTYGITTTQYDGLNRVIKTIKQDGNFSTVSYSDNCTTTADEAGHQRKACVDALGRLVNVWEDPAGLNYETDYQYDTLGNLTRVDQKGSAPGDSSQWRTRTFTYDSVSRLLTSNNPESGTIAYAYDAASNLTTKTDARNISITYSYDQVNRLTLKTPSDGSPIVNLTYDQTSVWGHTLTNGIGRLTSEGIFPAWGQPYIQAALFAYDAMGRTTNGWECLPSGCPSSSTYQISAAYDLAGDMTSLTYPDGRVLNYAYDSAGRALSVTDSASGTQYVNNADYFPSGAQNHQWSPIIFQRFDLNNRLQPVGFYADNGQVSAFYQNKSYNYGSQNNGNLISIANNKDSSRSQSFTYDSLNRLTHAENSGTNCSATLPDGHTEYWGNNYVYDAWGNLLQKNVTKCSAETLTVTAQTNNRLSGYSYDAAGNMLSDSFHSYQFDADGQMTTVDNGAATYQYSSNGERIRKNTASGSTEYAYSAGNIIAEKNVNTGGWTDYFYFNGKRIARRDPSGSVHYYLSDHLGSTSMVVASGGAIENESEFYPWGGELQFSAADSANHYKFTGKEQDAESNLDHFGARNYSSTLGRWISADWSDEPSPVPYANLADPQTLNLFSYVRNSPVARVDTDGHFDDPFGTFNTQVGPVGSDFSNIQSAVRVDVTVTTTTTTTSMNLGSTIVLETRTHSETTVALHTSASEGSSNASGTCSCQEMSKRVEKTENKGAAGWFAGQFARHLWFHVIDAEHGDYDLAGHRDDRKFLPDGSPNPTFGMLIATAYRKGEYRI